MVNCYQLSYIYVGRCSRRSRVHPEINQSVVYQHLGEIEEACQVKRLEREMMKPDVRQLHVITRSRNYLLFFNYNIH